jgi:hypothetical protein
MSTPNTPTLYTKHSNTGRRSSPVYFYADDDELTRLKELTTRIADRPVSRSMVLRMALDLLSQMVQGGMLPDIRRYHTMRRQGQNGAPKGRGSRRQQEHPYSGLVVRLASLMAGAKGPHADAAA